MKSTKAKVNPSDRPVNYTNFYYRKNNIPHAAYTTPAALRKTVMNPRPKRNPAPRHRGRALTTAKQPSGTTNIPTPAQAKARHQKTLRHK